MPLRSAEDIAQDRGALVEEFDVKGLAEFPPRVVLRCLRADGTTAELVFAAMGAHKVSDELLKVAAAVRGRNTT